MCAASPRAAPEARPWRAAQSGIRYPVVVRFEKLNYAGVSTNNYAPNEAHPALALKRRRYQAYTPPLLRWQRLRLRMRAGCECLLSVSCNCLATQPTSSGRGSGCARDCVGHPLACSAPHHT